MALGYTFGGQHIHNFGIEMTGKEVPITPPFTNQSGSQSGRDGEWDFGMQYDPKIIPVEHYILTIDGPTTLQKIRDFAGLTNPRKGSQVLIFDDEPDKMYYARLNAQLNINEIIQAKTDFSLEFICYDPFTYSVTEYAPVITNSGVINHLGTHVAKPILVVDHKGGSATITNTAPDSSTQSVVFNSSTPAGLYTIDMKAGTVKQGTTGADKYIDSIQWIEMQQGNNTITHTANINNVTVQYRDTWL